MPPADNESQADAPAPATGAGASATTYDAVPYSIGAFPQTHPDRLATIGMLFGLNPAPPQGARVLELGCAAGGNLIPMAWAMPQGRFVGIDLSARQISDGQAAVAELGLSNLDLRAMSILDAGPELGEFDYILAHGVYSWVPPEVQDRILDICRDHLAPHGIAYISYNTYPGWHARGAIREMLWYHTARFEDPVQRIREARGLLKFLTDSVPPDDAGFGSLIRRELGLLRSTPDTYLLHEHLEEYNEPLYFHQFIGRVAEKGLQYLAEAQLTAMVPSRLGDATEQTLRSISPSLLHMEQYMDFLRNRMFRQTLLCRTERNLERALRPEGIYAFSIAANANPASQQPSLDEGVAEGFAIGSQTLTTRDPLMKAAMLHLGRRWPLPVPFDELLEVAQRHRAEAGATPAAVRADDRRQLATRMLHCYASGLVEFSITPPRFVVDVSPSPIASPYARLRARHDLKVTNLRLESIGLSEPSRLALLNLDGRHDRAALVDLLTGWVESQAGTTELTVPNPRAEDSEGLPVPSLTPRERAGKYIDQVLPAFARCALLVG